LAQQGPGDLPYPLQPAADGAHHTQFGLWTRINGHDFTAPELLRLAAPHHYMNTSRLERHIFDAQPNELARAKCTPKTKEQQRPIAIAPRASAHGSSDLHELFMQQRRCALLLGAMHATHVALELAD
jgi:hypothetical protein